MRPLTWCYMPNGKGSLDCCYCVHFDGTYPEGHGQERLCRFHQTIVPKGKDPTNNRLCGNFTANEIYYAHETWHQFFPLARRFAWFGIDLEPGVLYEFCYNVPKEIVKSAVLRIPDYHNGTWKMPD